MDGCHISCKGNQYQCLNPYMDESCVLLVNLHQLLISFVPHAGLGVCSHCNEVWYTLHRQDISVMCANAYIL